MTRFEEIGVKRLEEAVTIDEIFSTAQRSCNICATQNRREQCCGCPIANHLSLKLDAFDILHPLGI